MRGSQAHTAAPPTDLTNGSGAAAILATGIGALALALIAIAANKVAWVKSAMTFYKPTGPLSGVTTSAVIVWLVVWVFLESRWRKRQVAMGRIGAAAFVLLALSLLLTFPPIADLL
jgi:hypothetical protein